MPSWIFESWESLLRTGASGLLTYAALVALLRISGKRTLSKMNAFDFIVTVAFGSMLATIMLSSSVPLADGVLALALLVCMQYLVTWVSVRSDRFQSLVKADPTVMLYRGRYFEDAMRGQRVTRQEILAAIRKSGALSPDEVGAVIMETEGTLTVMGDVGESSELQVLDPVSNAEQLPADATG